MGATPPKHTIKSHPLYQSKAPHEPQRRSQAKPSGSHTDSNVHQSIRHPPTEVKHSNQNHLRSRQTPNQTSSPTLVNPHPMDPLQTKKIKLKPSTGIQAKSRGLLLSSPQWTTKHPDARIWESQTSTHPHGRLQQTQMHPNTLKTHMARVTHTQQTHLTQHSPSYSTYLSYSVKKKRKKEQNLATHNK